VLMYVLLTGRQPFSTPKTDDPMVVMRRIVDENYQIKYPPYLTGPAKVGEGRVGAGQARAVSHAGVAGVRHGTPPQPPPFTPPPPSPLRRCAQDLIARLLERKPAKRIGMLNGRANDIKNHKWFEGLSWEELEARRTGPPRRPKESDSSKRLKELVDSEKKTAGKVPKETPEELQECELVFSDF
jgi:cGMP-dependent protein kinase 2